MNRPTKGQCLVAVALVAMLAAGCSRNEATPGLSTSTTTLPAPTSTLPTTTTTTSIESMTTTSASSVTVDPYLPSALGREEIPWSEVGAGWYVVLFDSSKAYAESEDDLREGPVALYLVDSEGIRYEVTAWSANDRPWGLVDAVGTSALVVGNGRTIDDTLYTVVDLTTGVETAVHDVGFPESSYGMGWAVSLTRPTGRNVVVYRSDGDEEWLERRSLSDNALTMLYRQQYTDVTDTLRWLYGHDGTFLLVGHRNGISEVSNSGEVLSELWAPDGALCSPVRWWDQDTYLATCFGIGSSAPLDDFGNPHTSYGRLWLLETDGSAGEPLTEYPSEPPVVVDFGYSDAWPSDAGTLIQWTGDCGAASVAILQPDGTGEFVNMSLPESLAVQGESMVDVVDGRLAVYAWDSCDGSVGTLFITDLEGIHLRDLVPMVGDARSVIGARGLATVYP